MEFKKVKDETCKWTTSYDASYILTDEEVLQYKKLKKLKQAYVKAMEKFEEYSNETKMSIDDYIAGTSIDSYESCGGYVAYFDKYGNELGSFCPRTKSYGDVETGWQTSEGTC